jgi:outer membrane immunogenic protein
VIVGQSVKKLSLLSAIATGGTIFLVQSCSTSHAAGPAYSWSRCYVGAEAGAATSTSRWTYTNSNLYSSTGNFDPQLVSGADFNDNRGVIGLQAGCNRAIADYLLVGIEGSWFSNPMNSRNDNRGFTPFPSSFGFNEAVTTNIQSVFSLTPRLGIAVSPDWLLYAKGGYAAARIETSGTISPNDFLTPLGDFTTTAWHGGWTAGAGAEYRLFRNVTIGLEYDYYRFANVAHSGIAALPDIENGVPVPGSPINHRVNADVQTLMARVNFAFDAGPATGDAGPSAAYAAYVKAPPRAAAPNPWSAFTYNEVDYASWTGTRGANVFAPDRGAGYQVYSPTMIGIDYNMPSEYKLEARVKGGYVYSTQNTAGQVARYEGPVDTQASFNLTFLNFDSIRPLLGLALNLPTGNSYLPGNQRFTRMDPDLVPVGSYGVGFNVNPTAGFTFGLNETTAVSLSAGYTWQGDFTKEGINFTGMPNPLGPPPENVVYNTLDLQQKIHPGDVFTANGNISSKFGKLSLMASFAYMGSTRASIDNLPTGRTGANFTANGVANYQIDDRWALSTNVSWNFVEKSEIPDGLGGLVSEPKNSNSNVVIGSFEPSYMASDRLRLAVNYSFLYRDQNYYDQLEQQFIPAKQKQLVGGSVTYLATPTATVTFRGSHAWVQQNDGPLLLTEAGPPIILALQPPMLKYEVWATSVAANISF